MKKVINFFKKIFSNRKRLAIFIIFLVVAGFIGLRLLGSRAVQPQYQTVRVERGTIVVTVTASGQILTSQALPVATGASGIVKNVFVKSGDEVSAGEKLLEITLDLQSQQHSASAWSSYLSAKNTLESAKATQYSLQSEMFSKWKTFKDLAESSSYDSQEERSLAQFHIAEKDWLAAEAKYKNQQNVVEQTQASLNNTWLSYQLASSTVTAPSAGTVSDLVVAPGMTIGGIGEGATATTAKIATIKARGTPFAQFNLSEIDVSRVKPGQKATITLDAQPEKTYTGKVLGIDKTGIVSSGVVNYPVTIQFESEALEILPNMSAGVNIIVDFKDNALLVPASFVQTQEGQSLVRVRQNGQIQQVPVETGLSSEIQIEIISGLSEGDEVLTSTAGGSEGQSSTSPFSSFRFGGGGVGQGGLRSGGGGRGNPMQR
ncbi:MAG: efflux RND transporter periplasmic adaptor subunit [bacterium]|nr:efflux RND transporter periplasmic adaptor subunit [bacterium]